jgi:hypothetical protein
VESGGREERRGETSRRQLSRHQRSFLPTADTTLFLLERPPLHRHLERYVVDAYICASCRVLLALYVSTTANEMWSVNDRVTARSERPRTASRRVVAALLHGSTAHSSQQHPQCLHCKCVQQ